MNVFSEITINYKPLLPFTELEKIGTSEEATRILRTHWSEQISYREEFNILLLNQANCAIGFTRISGGGLNSTIVDVRMIFQAALKANASSVILAHNHPSGNLMPSKADINITKKVISVGEALDIKVLDHVILTAESFYSLADNGVCSF